MAAVVAAAPPAAVTSYPAAFFAADQPNTALDMVNRLPGFTFDNGGAVRGFAGAAGNVIIDGARPASKDDSVGDLLRRIPASSVLRIEVIRGGAPGIDMQGKTVLANVIRRQDIDGKLTVNASTTHGVNNDQASASLLVEGEKRVGQTSLDGSLRIGRYLDDGEGRGLWTRTFAGGGPVIMAHEDGAGAEENYKLTGAIETPALGGKIRFNASLLIDPYANTTNDPLAPPPGDELDRFYNEVDTAEFGLRFDRTFGSGLALQTFLLQQLGRQKTTDDFFSDPRTAALTGDDVSANFLLKKRTGESIARTIVKIQAAKTLALEVGGEGDFNWLKSDTHYVENGVLTPLPAADVEVDELRGEVSATATWQALRTLTLEAGIRTEASRITSSGDVISERSLIYPKPRLALAWSPDAADQLRLRIEREVGQLDFDDFTAQTAGLNTGTVHAGNPALNPDQDWVIEAAWDRRFWTSGDATVTLRHYALSDVVDRIGVYDPSGTYDAPGNIGSGTKDEADLTLSLPTDKLGIKGGLITGQGTLRRSQVTDPTLGLPRPISGLHASDWQVHFTQGLPHWKASWGLELDGPWIQTFYRFDEVDTDKLNLFTSAFAEYKPKPDLSLRLEMLNLLGRGFEHVREVYDGPRNDTPLDFTDVRHIRTGRFLRIRVIKSFG